MSWLDQHIEEFVKPHLEGIKVTKGGYDPMGMSPEITAWEYFDKGHGREPLRYFAQEELTVIKNTWRSIKKAAKGKQILLPGRDVFVFEILARREGYPTVFMPECSRMTVVHISKQPEFDKIRRACYLFDTGFAGSIPIGLKMNRFGLMSHAAYQSDFQLFPRLTRSRGLALKIERTPKYWESGRLVGGYTWSTANTCTIKLTKDLNQYNVTTAVAEPFNPLPEEIVQPFSNTQEFIQAARLTIEIWRNNAPKFINRHKPVACIG